MTHSKGDLACAAAIKDLTLKGHNVFIPAVAGHLRYDLVAEKDGVFYRIQAKYSTSGAVSKGAVSANCGQINSRPYKDGDFDFYAVYLPFIDTVVYPSLSFAGCWLRAVRPTSPCSYWWYEDFLDFTTVAKKHTLAGKGVRKSRGKSHEDKPVVSMVVEPGSRPSRAQLEKLVWEIPATEIAALYGVTHSAVGKWIKIQGIDAPGKGYWQKKYGQWKKMEASLSGQRASLEMT
jgi:hypothetical protein